MGTSTERREDAGLKAALCTGKPKAAFFPTSADQPIISSKPDPQFWPRTIESVGSDLSAAVGWIASQRHL
jgi:hypothetical protein